MAAISGSSVEGKVAVITGGSKGIGAATVLHLVSLGASVVFSYSSDIASADALAVKINAQYPSEVDSSPPRALAFKADAASIPDNEALDIANIDEAEYDLLMSVNVKGPFFLTKLVAPHLAPGSHVIFLSSALTAVSNVLPQHILYVATKGAIEQIARALSKDLARRGICVNIISPGPTATELFFKGKDDALLERIQGTIPMGRIGTPEEVAEVIGWLAGDGSRWVSGQNIRADGGMA